MEQVPGYGLSRPVRRGRTRGHLDEKNGEDTTRGKRGQEAEERNSRGVRKRVESSSDPPQKIGRRGPEAPGEPQQGSRGRITPSVLDLVYVREVDAASSSQNHLRHTGCFTRGA
jgi:hypothetical protein